MQTKYTVILSLATGFALGAATIQILHAQAKPPGYVIAEVNVKDPDGYKKATEGMDTRNSFAV